LVIALRFLIPADDLRKKMLKSSTIVPEVVEIVKTTQRGNLKSLAARTLANLMEAGPHPFSPHSHLARRCGHEKRSD